MESHRYCQDYCQGLRMKIKNAQSPSLSPLHKLRFHAQILLGYFLIFDITDPLRYFLQKPVSQPQQTSS